MSDWKAKYNGKWYGVKEVQDTGIPAHKEGGGNVYHLEEVGPVHQSKIEDLDMSPLKKKDVIPGGLADNKSPSDFDSKKLAAGIKIELEHTSDRSIAQEIAMDHLTEDNNYYEKLATIEKQEMKIVSADGKQEIVEGKEPLKKDPKEVWKRLKKNLNNSDAFMDLAEESAPEEPEEQPQPQEQEDESAQAPEEEPQEDSQEEPEMQEPQDDQTMQDNADQDPEQAMDPSQAEEQIKQALKDEGYSDQEIAYIVHGHHAPELSETDSAKADATKQMSDIKTQDAQQRSEQDLGHSKRMADHEHEHKKRMADVEYDAHQNKKKEADLELEHKKRMLELEFEKSKKELDKQDPTDDIKRQQMQLELDMKRKEKELELEYKKKELDLKLKLQEQSAKQKATHAARQAEDDAVTNSAVKKEQAKHKINEAKIPPFKKEEPFNV